MACASPVKQEGTSKGVTFVNSGAVSSQQPTLPSIDIDSLHQRYNQLKSSDSESPFMLDMYALMINIHANQSETEVIKSELLKTNSRLDAVEAKIGGADEISERLGLVIRMLPLPQQGETDLSLVRRLFMEMRIPGFDSNREVARVLRKFPSKPPNNPSYPLLGAVLVEMRSEDSKTKIMKNKHVLEKHPDESVQRIVIKNMRSRERMFMENLGNSLVQKIPGCENYFVAPNGQLRERSLGSNRSRQPRPTVQHRNLHEGSQAQTVPSINSNSFQHSGYSNLHGPPDQQFFASRPGSQQFQVPMQYPPIYQQHPLIPINSWLIYSILRPHFTLI